MEIKGKVFKRKSGKSKDKWIIRVEYFDEISGRKRDCSWSSPRKTLAILQYYVAFESPIKNVGECTVGAFSRIEISKSQ